MFDNYFQMQNLLKPGAMGNSQNLNSSWSAFLHKSLDNQMYSPIDFGFGISSDENNFTAEGAFNESSTSAFFDSAPVKPDLKQAETKTENIDLTALFKEVTGEEPPKQEKAIAGELSEAAKYYLKHVFPPPDTDCSQSLTAPGAVNLNFERRLPVTAKNKDTINTGIRQIPRITKYDSIINNYAQKYGIDPLLIKCIIYQESQFKPAARSNKGARGLMQLTPGTAREQGVTNPLNPGQNIAGGVKYFAKQMKKFGNNVPLALAAYNAGPARVKNGKVPLIRETQDYVYNIIQMDKKLSGS